MQLLFGEYAESLSGVKANDYGPSASFTNAMLILTFEIERVLVKELLVHHIILCSFARPLLKFKLLIQF